MDGSSKAHPQEGAAPEHPSRRLNPGSIPVSPLAPKHGICDSVRLRLGRRLRVGISGRRSNRAIRTPVGDPLKCVGYPGQLDCNLIGSPRRLQKDDSFSAEVKSDPKQEPNREQYARRKHVVTGNGKASACDRDDVVREQGILPAGACGLPTLLRCKSGPAE